MPPGQRQSNCAKDICREARDKANNKAISASLEAMRNKAKFASKGRAKIITLPCEATLLGDAILASLITKKKVFKTKPKASQPKGTNFQSLRVFVMDHPVNADLRDYLSNKRKLALRNLLTARHPYADKQGVNL